MKKGLNCPIPQFLIIYYFFNCFCFSLTIKLRVRVNFGAYPDYRNSETIWLNSIFRTILRLEVRIKQRDFGDVPKMDLGKS